MGLWDRNGKMGASTNLRPVACWASPDWGPGPPVTAAVGGGQARKHLVWAPSPVHRASLGVAGLPGTGTGTRCPSLGPTAPHADVWLWHSHLGAGTLEEEEPSVRECVCMLKTKKKRNGKKCICQACYSISIQLALLYFICTVFILWVQLK